MTRLKAERLLEKLFSYVKSDEHTRELNVLVVCAGSFPSYSAFRNHLIKKFPGVEKIHFTLIEPSENKIHLFKKNNQNNSAVSFEFVPTTLQSFLKEAGEEARLRQISFSMKKNFDVNSTQNNDRLESSENFDKKFDIIYFEHPDLRTVTIPLAKLFHIYKNTVSLRKSISELHPICKPNTIIIASNMSKHENIQLKHLLKFFLGCRSKLISFSDKKNSAFHYGLIAEIKHLTPNPSSSILIYDGALVLFTISFIFMYGLRLIHSKSLFYSVFPVLLLMTVYYFHRPGKCWLLIIIFCQLLLMYIPIPGQAGIYTPILRYFYNFLSMMT